MKLNATNLKRHIHAYDVVKLKNTKTISDVSNFFIKKHTTDQLNDLPKEGK